MRERLLSCHRTDYGHLQAGWAAAADSGGNVVFSIIIDKSSFDNLTTTSQTRPKGATTVLKLGGSERRRREPSRGAENAEGVKRGEGVSPFPLGERSENFLLFYLKMVSFGAFWVALLRCM